MKLGIWGERIVWLMAAGLIVYGAVFVTNYVRDHEVYRVTATKCSTDQSILGQEIDQLKAELQKKEMDIDNLKTLPAR